MREAPDVDEMEVDAGGGWRYRSLELGSDDMAIILDALYRYASEERAARPRRADDVNALRRRLLLRSVDCADMTVWRFVGQALPPEST